MDQQIRRRLAVAPRHHNLRSALPLHGGHLFAQIGDRLLNRGRKARHGLLQRFGAFDFAVQRQDAPGRHHLRHRGEDGLPRRIVRPTLHIYSRATGRFLWDTSSIVVDGSVEALAALPGVHDLARQDGHVTFAVDDDQLPSVLAAVASLHPRSITANPPSLEELFLRHYGDELAALNGMPR